MNEWMNEVTLDTRVVRAGEMEKGNFLFYSSQITFSRAERGLTEAMDLESVNLGTRQTARFLEGKASILSLIK